MMKENEIRPQDLMAENLRLHDADVERLFGDRRGFVEVPCPACAGSDHEYAFEKNGFRFVGCRGCGTLMVNPRPPAGTLNAFYGAPWMLHWNERIFPASEEARRERIFAPRARRVEELCRRHGVTTGTLLDAGAGFGTFAEEVGKLGVFCRVIANEPSPGLAATCRRKGLETVEKRIEDVVLDGVDVITNFELIEHLFDPAAFVASCARVLSPGGLLILTTPNIRGFDLLVLKERSDNIAAPEHLNYFTPESLTLLLERCGLRTEEVLTPGRLDADIVRNKVLSGEMDVSAQPFLREVLVDGWEKHGAAFQEFLAASGLSSHLWVVARKV